MYSPFESRYFHHSRDDENPLPSALVSIAGELASAELTAD